MLLSIVMMVKNESKYLDKCLSSLEKLRTAVSSELIIVDTGSDDNTVEIAKKYTSKVYCHRWVDDFGAMRNITIGYAKGQWLLVLDADEVLEDSWPIIDFFNSKAYKKYNVAMVKIKSYSYTDGNMGSISTICRLFKNYSGFCYEGIIHEQPQIKPPVCIIEALFLHYGYVSDDEELMKRKFLRNTQLLKLALEKDPENIYALFQLSQTYGMRKDYPTALELAYKTYRIAKDKKLNLSKYMYVYTQLAQMYYYTEDYINLEEICQEGLKIKEGLADLYCLLGYAKQKLFKNSEALYYYQKYLSLLEMSNSSALSDITISVYTLDSRDNVIANMCKIYDDEKKYDQVIEFVSMLREESFLRDSIPYFVKACLLTDDVEKLYLYYNNCILVKFNQLKNHFLLYLELHIKDLQQEKKKNIYKKFSADKDNYALVNLVRINILDNTNLDEKDIKQIYNLDFNNLADYYGACIFYLIKHRLPFLDILVNLQEYKVENYFRYILSSYNETFADEFFVYLKSIYPQYNISKCKITRNIAKSILLNSDIKDEDFNLIFKRYINESITFLKQIYNPFIIEKELISEVKNEEEAFIIYMLKANEVKAIDEFQYISYLRKAIKIYPIMQRGIKYLLNQVENKIAKNNELEEFQSKVKDNIIHLIKLGEINDAIAALSDYKSIVKDDIDIYAIESNIAIIKEEYSLAEKNLREGLGQDPSHFDLLCNAAYLCQIQGRLDDAVDLYKCSLAAVRNEMEKEQLERIILQLTDAEAKTENETNTDSHGDEGELKAYQQQVKGKIQELIQDNLLENAKELIKEYEVIITNDIDIYSLKAMIAMHERDYITAETLLKDAEATDQNNFNVLCNLGYLYEEKGNYEKAKAYYNRAIKNDESQGQIEVLQEKVTMLSNKPVDLRRKKTSIIVLTYNNLEYNKLCINSIRNYTRPETYELIIVDNASTDGTLEWLKEQNDIKLIVNSINEGFPKGCNQGIAIAEENNDILLLNNDTIVMPNWLDNLQTALHSSDTVGAVGAITNSCSNYQAISLPYDNFDEVLAFATNHNHSNSDLWEERLRLVGFCMLIKGDAIQKIGLLDERFTPGNFEDDDYSIRIRQQGLRLLLCKDTFIYHFGSMSFSKEANKYNDVLIRNKAKFHEKWGFDPYYITTINKDITQYLKSQQRSFENILQIECAGGGTLLDIKNEFPSVDLFGIEKNSKLLYNYEHYADIKVGGFKSIEIFEKEFFDVIISISTVCKINKLKEQLKKLFQFVKPNGIVILKLAEKTKGFNIQEVEKHQIYFDSLVSQGNVLLAFYRKDTDAPMVSKENSISIKRINQRELLSIHSKNPLADLNDKQLGYILRRIESGFNSEEDLESLWNYLNRHSSEGKEKIIRWVDMKATNKVLILNLIASLYYANNKILEALSILEYAYTINPQYTDTVYNISLIVYQLGDKQTALQFLNNAEPLEGELLSLKQEIMEA